MNEGELSGSREIGEDRDRAAEERDRLADLRDQKAELRDQRAEALEAGGEAQSERVIAERRHAAEARQLAKEDRQKASSDRAAAARDRRSSSLDDLTGAYRRAPGVLELKRELARAQRNQVPFTLAFIDIDGLKSINEQSGRDAGDVVLKEAAGLFRQYFRPYDLMVRYGGDEFTCALWGMTSETALKRFAQINEDLRKICGASFSVGLASREGDEELEAIIVRADRAMYDGRRETSAGD